MCNPPPGGNARTSICNMKDRWSTLYCESGHLGTGRHNDAIRKAVEPPAQVVICSFNYAACGGRRRGQFISQGNARPRVPCYARRCVSSRARNRTPLVLMWRALIHEESRIGLQQKTSRTIHQPRQCSTARSMLRSKLCQLQSPKQNAPCFDVEGFNS